MARQPMRLHQFPPLRKVGLDNEGSAEATSQQRLDGFQQGVSEGFAQGLTQGRNQGYEDGLQQGREAGHPLGFEAGKQQALAHFLTAAAPLDALTTRLQALAETQAQQRKTELVALVEKVTRQVIRCELALQPTQLLALIDEALASLPALPTTIRILLNAEEFARITALEPEKAARWGLVADGEMAPGECRILTDDNEMDIGCNQRLSQCLKVLQENLAGPEQTDTEPEP